MITRTEKMADTEYCISSSSSDDASSTASFSILPSASIKDDSTHCNCQQRAATNNCSSRQKSSKRNMISTMSITSPVFLVVIMLVFISYFTCCVSAWPILNHRRTYNYAPPSVVIPDYNELVDINQWALAAQPDNYYDTLPALPLQQQQIDQDGYDDEPIYEQEPEEETYQMPFFGPIMDPVEPEEEQELEDLKHQQPFVYEKRIPSNVAATVKSAVASPSATSSHPATTPVPTSPSSTPSSKSKVTAGQAHLESAPRKAINNGQKEIAMLRPPSGKSHHIQLDEPEDLKISVAQRSPSNEKPSAYDRLRKYLSLDDALKKEYQQRRANAMNRHHAKRESIITDSDSLTGQLNNLKKNMD